MTDASRFVEEHQQIVEALFESIDQSREDLIALIREIAEIPAPSYQEEKRTEFLLEQLPAVGLRDVHALPKGSVLGYSRSRSEGNTLLLAAHIDTVFPAETDLTTRIEGSRLYGPGTGDNATNVAALLTLARLLKPLGIRLGRNVAFCGNVCEEGKGGLAGIREVVAELGNKLGEVIAVDGVTATIVNRSVAIRRHLIRIEGPGGHGWETFGSPSAIHEMGRIVAAVRSLEVPTEPKTTFNVGVIRGGTSVNAIAQQCEAEVELRSLEQQELEQLEHRFLEIVHDASSLDLEIGTEIIDERPGAALAPDHRLVVAAASSAVYLGLETQLTGASTDTAIPLSCGIPAVGFGIYRGKGEHTLEEYVALDSLTTGLKRLALAVLMLCGVEP
jgi:acetylornithine deacetylase/succinyl-diaminopimelate desuccinylase-like protein